MGRTQKAFSRQISRGLWNKRTTAHYGTKPVQRYRRPQMIQSGRRKVQRMEEMKRQMMEEICLYRSCERDVSADNGVALDGWGTSPSPDDGDRLLSPNKESAFCKRSKREKNQYHQQQQQQQNFGTEQQQHQQRRND